jgi:hypothetical protein
MFFATMSLARSPAVSDEVSDEAMLFLLFPARIVFCYFGAKAEDFLLPWSKNGIFNNKNRDTCRTALFFIWSAAAVVRLG